MKSDKNYTNLIGVYKSLQNNWLDQKLNSVEDHENTIHSLLSPIINNTLLHDLLRRLSKTPQLIEFFHV
jgi:hypothetical protein